MPNDHFDFKQFRILQSRCSQKVSTDACLFGAWVAERTESVQHVLDIGAGTGLLMLMLAQKHEALIEGIEIEASCADQSRVNIEASPWKNRLNIIHDDAKTFVAEKKYDLVISNPPFYENQLRSPDPVKNLAWHSDAISLAELTCIASGLLTVTGKFCLLLPFSREEEAVQTGATYLLYPSQILTVRHTSKHPFGRVMIMFSKQKSDVEINSLEIRNEDGSYSDAFIRLLKDYYLFL